MYTKNTVIFDMDGVIFDSEQIVLNSWKKVADEYGLENIETVMKQCIGLNYQAASEVFTKAYDGKYDFDFLKPKTSAYYYEHVEKYGLPVKAGVEELLICLKERGYKTAVASSTRIAVVEKEIADAGLTKYFEKLVGGDMIQRSKPAPDIFLEAARVLDAKAEECFVIEDSYNGIRAAHAASMTPLMVPDLLPPTEEMKQLAEAIFNNLLEVKTYITTNFDITKKK